MGMRDIEFWTLRGEGQTDSIEFGLGLGSLVAAH